MALLDAYGVTKRFGGLTALDDVGIKVEEGSVHAIIGPNGAGKSTLINVLTGRIAPDSGSVVFDGHPLIDMAPHDINQLGLARVFQTPEIFLDMSCLENVTIAGLAARDGSFKANLFEPPSGRRSIEQYAEELLVDVGLKDKLEVEAAHLARGDKRRLELAICLAHRPRLLLLDEPTAGMSQHDTQSTIQLLKRISERGMTKIIIEHDMGVVFSLSERITVLQQGRVIAEGTPVEIREDPKVHEAYLGGADE